MPPPAASVEATTDTQGITIPDPLSLESVQTRRNKAGKLIAGVAATADIELFKGRGHHAHKPKAKNFERTSHAPCSQKPS